MSKNTTEWQTQNCTACAEQEDEFEHVEAAISQNIIPTHFRLYR